MERKFLIGTSHSYGGMIAVGEKKEAVSQTDFFKQLKESLSRNMIPVEQVEKALLVGNLKLGVSVGSDYFLIQDIKKVVTPPKKKEKKPRPMKIYVGKNKSEAKLMLFEDLLDIKLQRGGYTTDIGDGDEDSWVGAIQVTDKPSEVTTYFHFKDDEISKITVWESPIKTIVDDDNMKQIS